MEEEEKEKRYIEEDPEKRKAIKNRSDAIDELNTTDPPTLTIAILEAIGLNIFSGSEFNNAIKNLTYSIDNENNENLKQEMGKVLTLANRANTLYKERMKIQNIENKDDKQQKLTINTRERERDKVKEDAKNLLNNLLNNESMSS